MAEGTIRPAAKVLLATLVGLLAGGGVNAALGEQGADTPALALLGGGLALGLATAAQARRCRHRAPGPRVTRETSRPRTAKRTTIERWRAAGSEAGRTAGATPRPGGEARRGCEAPHVTDSRDMPA